MNNIIKLFILFVLINPSITSLKAQIHRNLKSDKISYDSKSLILNGNAEFIYSGAFHYFRCPKELWEERFKTIKEAGFNTVETYIPWNRHERQKPSGLNDFSKIDFSEFESWLIMAEKFGFYVIVRPGPFICAEYDRGGYPGWLTTLRPEKSKQWMWFRSDDPLYLAWSEHWMKAFCSFISLHQVTQRTPGSKGVILFQLENEFSHVYFPAKAKVNAIKSLVNIALSNGIEVPMIACETPEISQSKDSLLKNNIFESRNFYPYFDVKQVKSNLEALRIEQPDAPLMTTELQGGWFPFVWQSQTFNLKEDYYPKNISPTQIQNLTLYCIQNGQTILNFYMLFGGTNYDGFESKDMQTSYDYGAPIREHGGVGEKYQRVKAIGLMLKEHGTNFIHSILSTTVQTKSGNKEVNIALRTTPENKRYIFIRNNNPKKSYSGKAFLNDKDWASSFNYSLKPFESKILYLQNSVTIASDGEWLPKELPVIKRPINLPKSIHLNSINYANDLLPTEWKPIKMGQSLLDLGVYDNRYVYYKAVFDVKSEHVDIENYVLRVTYPFLPVGSLDSKGKGLADNVCILMNGKKIEHTKAGLPGDFIIPTTLLKNGKNDLIAIYENTGYPKEFVYMEKEAGILDMKILNISKYENNLTYWKFKEVSQEILPDQQPEITTDFNDKKWHIVKLIQIEPSFVNLHKRGIFRKNVQITQKDIQERRTALYVSQLGDLAWVYVNGKKVAESNSRILSRTFDLKNVLKIGLNNIAIVVDNYDIYAKGGMGVAKLTYAETKGLAPESFYYSNQQTDPFNFKNWNNHLITSTSLILWGKLNFELPRINDLISVPWMLKLKASGNCRIFLNNHLIGRYWQRGKQNDFYLPECWLKKLKGQQNVITLQLMNNDMNVLIESADIIPFNTYATFK